MAVTGTRWIVAPATGWPGFGGRAANNHSARRAHHLPRELTGLAGCLNGPTGCRASKYHFRQQYRAEQ